MTENHRKLIESVLSAFCRGVVEIKAVVGQIDARPQQHHQGNIPAGPGETGDITRAVRQEEEKLPEKKVLSVEEAQQLFGGTIVDTD